MRKGIKLPIKAFKRQIRENRGSEDLDKIESITTWENGAMYIRYASGKIKRVASENKAPKTAIDKMKNSEPYMKTSRNGKQYIIYK